MIGHAAMQALLVRIAIHHAQIAKLFAALGRNDDQDSEAEGLAPQSTSLVCASSSSSLPSSSRQGGTRTSTASHTGGGVVRRLREARDAAEKLHAARREYSSTQLMFLEMILEGLNDARYALPRCTCCYCRCSSMVPPVLVH